MLVSEGSRLIAQSSGQNSQTNTLHSAKKFSPRLCILVAIPEESMCCYFLSVTMSNQQFILPVLKTYEAYFLSKPRLICQPYSLY